MQEYSKPMTIKFQLQATEMNTITVNTSKISYTTKLQISALRYSNRPPQSRRRSKIPIANHPSYVSSTKLVGDWVLAESQQVAVKCTTQEVLQAYPSGDLQQQWNKKEVLECSFKQRTTLPSAASDETDFKKPLNLKSWGSTRTGTRGTRSMNMQILGKKVGNTISRI